jgi:hypothetical protein
MNVEFLNIDGKMPLYFYNSQVSFISTGSCRKRRADWRELLTKISTYSFIDAMSSLCAP